MTFLTTNDKVAVHKKRSFVRIPVIYACLFARKIRELADRGSGYERNVLAKYGDDNDKTTCRSIGFTNLAATGLGTSGIFLKSYLLIPGLLAFPAAVGLAALYGVIVYNLERTLARGLSPLLPPWAKARIFTSRLLISCVTASFAAIPWIALALHGQVENKLSEISLMERQVARTKLADIHDIQGAKTKTSGAEKALGDANSELAVLPEAIADAIQLHSKCSLEADALFATNKKMANSLNSRLPGLSNIIMSPTATVIQKKAAEASRGGINRRLAALAEAVVAKRAECSRLETAAVEAKNRHLQEATVRRDKAAGALEKQKQATAQVEEDINKDAAKADVLTAKVNVANSTAEAKAIVALIRDEVFAKIIAGAIFIFFLLIDLAPIALKLLVLKPGPYDLEMLHLQELEHTRRAAEIRQALEAEKIAAATSAARVQGVLTFHREDAGAVFARREKLDQENELALKGRISDIDLSAAELSALERFYRLAAETRERVKSNPRLAARLDEALDALRGQVTPQPVA